MFALKPHILSVTGVKPYSLSYKIPSSISLWLGEDLWGGAGCLGVLYMGYVWGMQRVCGYVQDVWSTCKR